MDASALIGINHHGFTYQPVSERILHWREFASVVSLEQLQKLNAKHCEDCGIPSCHTPVLENRSGCSIFNVIPLFNTAVKGGHWKTAYDILARTNNFPEFTGRICPAPCEAACTRAMFDSDKAVTIEMIERAIIEKAFAEKWVGVMVPPFKTGKSVAVIGSGPAGLACAQQLAREGHSVTVFEKSAKPGGLLRCIPNYKLEKWVVDRRIEQMKREGVKFICGVDVGTNAFPVEPLMRDYDAVVLAGGAQLPRDLSALGGNPEVDGRGLKGVHYALELLSQENWDDSVDHPINAKGKHVVVVGGGDTGSDCIGTSIRQGAASITQLEILPKPPEKRTNIWPVWSNALATSSAHEEGLELGILSRLWAANVQSIQGDGRVESLKYTGVDWKSGGPMAIEGSEQLLKADLILIAAGFLGAKKPGLLSALGVPFDRGNVQAINYQVPHPDTDKIFSAGDMRRGQSLVVWAIQEGRGAAAAVHEYLMGQDFKMPDLHAGELDTIVAQYPVWAQQFAVANGYSLALT